MRKPNVELASIISKLMNQEEPSPYLLAIHKQYAKSPEKFSEDDIKAIIHLAFYGNEKPMFIYAMMLDVLICHHLDILSSEQINLASNIALITYIGLVFKKDYEFYAAYRLGYLIDLILEDREHACKWYKQAYQSIPKSDSTDLQDSVCLEFPEAPEFYFQYGTCLWLRDHDPKNKEKFTNDYYLQNKSNTTEPEDFNDEENFYFALEPIPFYLILQAAKLGHAEAKYHIAEFYSEGKTPWGVVDINQAIHWHTQAANAGYFPSHFKLAKLLCSKNTCDWKKQPPDLSDAQLTAKIKGEKRKFEPEQINKENLKENLIKTPEKRI